MADDPHDDHAHSACELPDEVMATVFGSANACEVADDLLSELERALLLIGSRPPQRPDDLDHAAVLLASVLGRLPRHLITHLPLGYEGPRVQTSDWIDRETLEQIGKQVVGLLWDEIPATRVSDNVGRAISGAIRSSYLEEQRYDAWRPGMRSGSGWRTAVCVTRYGVKRARKEAEQRAGAPAPGQANNVLCHEISEVHLRSLRALRDALSGVREAADALLAASGEASCFPKSAAKVYRGAMRLAEAAAADAREALKAQPTETDTACFDVDETLGCLSAAIEPLASERLAGGSRVSAW